MLQHVVRPTPSNFHPSPALGGRRKYGQPVIPVNNLGPNYDSSTSTFGQRHSAIPPKVPPKPIKSDGGLTLAGCRDSCSDTDSGIIPDNLSDNTGSVTSALCDVEQEILAGAFPDSQDNFQFPPPPYPEPSYQCLPRSRSSGALKSGSGSSKSAHSKLRVRFADDVTIMQNARLPDKIPPPYEEACKRIHDLRLSQGSGHSSQSQAPSNAYYYTTDSDSSSGLSGLYDPNYMRSKASRYVLNSTRSNEDLRKSPKTVLSNSCVMASGSVDEIVCLCPSEPTSLDRQKLKDDSKKQTGAKKLSGRKRFTSLERRKNQHQRIPSGPIVAGSLPNDHGNQTKRNIFAKLLALDSDGVQAVQLDKFDQGPFGFYIAYGTYKRKKGIYISKVCVHSLVPLLRIGDELLDVDGVSTKGRTLEQIQALMMNKNSITLRVLPAIAR